MITFELRRFWRNLELTVEEGIEELTSLCAMEVVIGNTTIQTIPEPRKSIKNLFDKAKITLPDAIPCRNISVDTRKKLVSERKIFDIK